MRDRKVFLVESLLLRKKRHRKRLQDRESGSRPRFRCLEQETSGSSSQADVFVARLRVGPRWTHHSSLAQANIARKQILKPSESQKKAHWQDLVFLYTKLRVLRIGNTVK